MDDPSHTLASRGGMVHHKLTMNINDICESRGLTLYPRSIFSAGETTYGLARNRDTKHLIVASKLPVSSFAGEAISADVLICPTSTANAAALREALPHLKPKLLGLAKSVGCGDRLGLATPGHVRAVRHSTMAPIFAQQSIRENARTGRTPQEVMDDALWGTFEEGWTSGFGADADHLKTTADIDSCAAAGFTFYTIDPGEHVDNEANTASVSTLQAKAAALPWDELESSWSDLQRQLRANPVDLGSMKVSISEEDLLRAAAKYGRVVAHTLRMYRHLESVMGSRGFELEMSVDETETVTNLAEHIYIAHELQRLGVKWVSLAPRYVGTFEKGVDYIGDLSQFEQSFREHLAVARTFGPYKLSLHSGSDKFSIYPIAARLAGDLVHLKTAGTSYLEALRAIAETNAPLFVEIADFARGRYPTDRASYHVSAEVSRMPPNESLAALLDNFDAREVLHVTFGSVLHNETLRGRFFATLRENEETYNRMLEKHFDRHLAPFTD
jgi:tagaturonate epimerase